MSQVPTQRPSAPETEAENGTSRRQHIFSAALFAAILVLLGLLIFLRYRGGPSEEEPELSSPVPHASASAQPEEPSTPAPVTPSPTPPAPTPTEPAPGESPAVERPWNLVLVNGDNSLEEDHQLPELTELPNGHAVDSRAYEALQDMLAAAEAEGLQAVICSSFRTWEKQEELFYRKVSSCLEQGCSQEEAEEEAAFWVARPGTSEHQLGLAVDIVDINYQLLDKNQESTPVQQWLIANCADYGFILRYPTDKSEITGVGYEPWHYRYVGIEAAKEITEQGICLEEYLQAVPAADPHPTA